MTGYIHISKRQPQAPAPSQGGGAPADPRVPAHYAKQITELRAALRREQTAAAQAKESRAKALRLADENAEQNRQLQTALDTARSEGHWLRNELNDARDANTALLADVADLSRQVTELKATRTAAAHGDVEAIITIRGTDLTTSRVDALAVHRALQAAGDSVLYHVRETAAQAAAAERATNTGTHLKAVSA